jgi:transcriptional regulator with XRE-family HTH domain
VSLGGFFWKLSTVIALPINGQYTVHMQALFSAPDYPLVMADKFRLRQLREAAGISVREVARQIGESHTNVSYWERSGQIPRSDVLLPMAKALGVTIEELLGEARPKRIVSPGGRARRLFEAISKMPRRQQDKVLDILEPFVREQGSAKAA